MSINFGGESRIPEYTVTLNKSAKTVLVAVNHEFQFIQ